MATLQFSDTTNRLGIIQSCEDICNLGATGISSDSNLLKVFTRYSNKAQSEIWSWIFSSYGGWQFDDGNQTDLPISTDTLTADKQDYALPTDAHTVRGIELKDEGGNWYKLSPKTEEEVRSIEADSEYKSSSGIPMYYRLMGETIRIYPPANYTQVSSFRVYYDRGMVAFTSADTTETPAIVSTFHDAIPVGASLEWLKIHKPNSNTTKRIENDWNNPNNPNSFYSRITNFYSKRFQQMFPARLKVNDAVSEFS